MNKALSIGSASLRHNGGTLNRRNDREAKAVKRAILTIGITTAAPGVPAWTGMRNLTENKLWPGIRLVEIENTEGQAMAPANVG